MALPADRRTRLCAAGTVPDETSTAGENAAKVRDHGEVLGLGVSVVLFLPGVAPTPGAV
ncbi:hypothetical protein ACFPN0_00450 [Kitasatospora cinereorecta]